MDDRGTIAIIIILLLLLFIFIFIIIITLTSITITLLSLLIPSSQDCVTTSILPRDWMKKMYGTQIYSTGYDDDDDVNDSFDDDDACDDDICDMCYMMLVCFLYGCIQVIHVEYLSHPPYLSYPSINHMDLSS